MCAYAKYVRTPRVMVKARLGSGTGLDEGRWLGVALVAALLHLLPLIMLPYP